MVHGLGGYRFTDHSQIGIPLTGLVIVMVVSLVSILRLPLT